MLCLAASPDWRLKGTRCRLGFGLGAVLLVQLFMLLPGPAEARPRYAIRDRAAPVAATQPTRPVEGPLQIVISIGSQRLWVYDSKGLLETSTISTGVGGYPTPTGVFAVIDKEVTHYSNIYGGASMPFMQRLTMSGVAMHSGMVTGRPASHGCVRLPHPFAVKLYRLTRLGARVVIAPNEPAPEDIVHTHLFVRKPAPSPEPVDPGSVKGVAMRSGMVTGRPASHGCIRLPHPFAIKLYKLTRLGVRVVIAPNEPVPQEITHARPSCASPLRRQSRSIQAAPKASSS